MDMMHLLNNLSYMVSEQENLWIEKRDTQMYPKKTPAGSSNDENDAGKHCVRIN